MATISNEEIVQTVADMLPVGVWVARAPGGEFVYANRTFQEIMGIAARDDVARGEYAEPYGIHTLNGDLYPEDRMPFIQALEARETITVDDIVIHRGDGNKVNIRAQARPVFEEGEISHIIIAFIDITREVRAEDARAESEARMRRAQRMESVGNLAGGVAHDFNNLLAAVKAIASSLRVREEDPAKREDLRTIDDATESAVELTRSLLGFAGRGKHRSEALSLDEIVQSVVKIVSRAIDPRIAIDVALKAARPVEGDHSQLEQVVMNLLMNARDAMPEGGQITVRTRSEEAFVILEVEDTGPGIPEDMRDRVFEPYFTTRTIGTQKGAGLGLATVYGIIESHGGRIEIGGGAQKGAVIRVALPATNRTLSSVARAREDPELERGSGLVLIVEDEPVVRRAAKSVLEALGYETLEAANGLEALELFAENHQKTSAVLLDMSMPGLDGREAFLALRDIDASVPVLLTTGYTLNEKVQEILDLGVNEFIQKPYGLTDISEALSRIRR